MLRKVKGTLLHSIEILYSFSHPILITCPSHFNLLDDSTQWTVWR